MTTWHGVNLEEVPGWCPRHIPHNLIAGGGLDSYGQSNTNHPDLGSTRGAHHGIAFDTSDASMGCAECLDLRRKEVENRILADHELRASGAGWPLVK